MQYGSKTYKNDSKTDTFHAILITEENAKTQTVYYLQKSIRHYFPSPNSNCAPHTQLL